MNTTIDFNSNDNKLWCIHDGEHTTVAQCPSTIDTGLPCSMPHIDQPDGKFAKDEPIICCMCNGDINSRMPTLCRSFREDHQRARWETFHEQLQNGGEKYYRFKLRRHTLESELTAYFFVQLGEDAYARVDVNFDTSKPDDPDQWYWTIMCIGCNCDRSIPSEIKQKIINDVRLCHQ